MKSTEFKKVIKEAVREAIQEELKDILFEAFKSQTHTSPITEHMTNTHIPSPQQTSNPTMGLDERRRKYDEALNGTALNFTSNDVQPFRPQSSDPVNGNLGEGNVSMDQITSLLNTK